MSARPTPGVALVPLSRMKLLVMYVSTAGCWSPFWFYRSLAVARQTTGQPRDALWRTLCFAALPISIATVVFANRLRDVVLWRPRSNPKSVAVGMLLVLIGCALAAPSLRKLFRDELSALREMAGGLIYVRSATVTTAVFIGLWLCWLLPNPFRFLGLLSVLPLMTVQLAINQYLDNLDIPGPEETRLSPFELVVAGSGGAFLLWALGGAVKDFVETMTGGQPPPV